MLLVEAAVALALPHEKGQLHAQAVALERILPETGKLLSVVKVELPVHGGEL